MDEFKAETDIIDFIERYTTLKKVGVQYVGVCPLPAHADNKPSFYVNPKRKVWFCHGCGKGGTVIDFYMAYHNVPFGKACEELGIEYDKTPEYGTDIILRFLEKREDQGGLF